MSRFAETDRQLERNLATVERLTGRSLGLDVAAVELVPASSLKPEPVRWLWPGWLARGKLHILAGPAGTGKTTAALAFAATVTAGGTFPSGWRTSHGNVLIWSGEDDPADTLVPRLLAAGADLSRVHIVGSVREREGARPFDPAHDVPLLAAATAELPETTLIIVDPIVSGVRGDSNGNAEVRRGLAPLVDLAARLDAALIGITHFSKGTGGREPLERVTGSLAFGALARLVFGTCRQEVEEGEPARMLLARIKSNIGPDGGGFAYAFEQTELPEHPGIEASRIAWGAAVEGSARELLADPEQDNEGNDAASFLRELLADGPMPTKDIRRHADNAGHAWRTVQRAMKRAGVVSRRGGFGLPATWELVDSRATVAPVAPHFESGATGATGGNLARLEETEVLEL